MTDYLEEYKEYYRLRMQRHENDANYPETFRVEKQMYEAVASASSLEACKADLQRLSNENAMARITDEYSIRLKHYEELNNPIQVASCRSIIEKARSCSTVSDLMTLVNDESNKLNLALTADYINPFEDSGYIERIEIWEQADVPEKYKSRFAQYAEEEKNSLRKAYAETEKQMNNFNPGWKFDFGRLWEERHRRKIPYPDAVIKRQIQQTKDILNAGR